MLEIGNRMPDFSAADQNGNIVKSADLIGKRRWCTSIRRPTRRAALLRLAV